MPGFSKLQTALKRYLKLLKSKGIGSTPIEDIVELPHLQISPLIQWFFSLVSGFLPSAKLITL